MLVENIKTQLPQLASKKKVQLLTIPASLNWPIKKIKETFQVSDYSVRQTQSLFKEKGFLAEREPRRGKKLKPEVITLVVNFYQSDEHSRVLPGMEDVVSLVKKQYKKKRLILSNFNEIYLNFKWEYPEKILHDPSQMVFWQVPVEPTLPASAPFTRMSYCSFMEQNLKRDIKSS